ncbi:hypothetical protein DL98DRAFT_578333 [Cadophora sp. DSE1049]|nr:hypothetical protein DL98DRAFT_578333 [Cadophora sp. DSE1049]
MPKPRPNPSSTRRPSAISRHGSLSYSPDSCDVTPLLRQNNLSEEETRRTYRRGKIVGVFLALGFLLCLGVLLVGLDVYVLKIGRGEGDGEGGTRIGFSRIVMEREMFKSRINRGDTVAKIRVTMMLKSECGGAACLFPRTDLGIRWMVVPDVMDEKAYLTVSLWSR